MRWVWIKEWISFTLEDNGSLMFLVEINIFKNTKRFYYDDKSYGLSTYVVEWHAGSHGVWGPG